MAINALSPSYDSCRVAAAQNLIDNVPRLLACEGGRQLQGVVKMMAGVDPAPCFISDEIEIEVLVERRADRGRRAHACTLAIRDKVGRSLGPSSS
jgi:hypothetical protein